MVDPIEKASNYDDMIAKYMKTHEERTEALKAKYGVSSDKELQSHFSESIKVRQDRQSSDRKEVSGVVIKDPTDTHITSLKAQLVKDLVQPAIMHEKSTGSLIGRVSPPNT